MNLYKKKHYKRFEKKMIKHKPIEVFHVVRYCFLNNALCLCESLIAHKHAFVFNNYDRSCTFHSFSYS